MKPDPTAAVREHVLFLLRGGGAHLDFDKAIADPARLPRVPPGMPIGMDETL